MGGDPLGPSFRATYTVRVEVKAPHGSDLRRALAQWVTETQIHPISKTGYSETLYWGGTYLPADAAQVVSFLVSQGVDWDPREVPFRDTDPTL